MGVAGAIVKRHLSEERGKAFGRAFEHFILMEIIAHASYSGLNYAIHYWRTKSGLMVDFILGGGEVAIEIKEKSRVEMEKLRPLAASTEEYRPKKTPVVCNEREERIVGNVRILPWRMFLEELWGGGIIS